jgi:threonine/homoserine/homoserine lactone efflux protein
VVRLAGIFGSSLLLGFSGALMPGPLFAAVVAGAAASGFWAGPAFVLGHALLELAVVLALGRGLGAVLSRPWVTRLVAAAGGATLLWLGISMVQDGLAQRITLDTAATQPLTAGPVLLGAVVSASNPYWVLWWATAGATYVALSLDAGAGGLAAFYTGHILSDLSWYSLVALAVASGRELLGPGPYNGLIAVAGGFLMVMGAAFLRTALRRRPAAAA